MANTAKIDINNGDILAGLQTFVQSLLESESIRAVLVPQHLPMKNVVMPTLVSDPQHLTGVDPLAPSFPMNAAKLVAKLTRKPAEGKVAALLRPCEIRAFIELVKLKQGRVDGVLLVGIDCLGAYQNVDYAKLTSEEGTAFTQRFCADVLSGEGVPEGDQDLAPACRVCEQPIPDGADILIGLYGVDTNDHLLAKGQTAQGQEVLEQLGLPEIEEPAGRRQAVADLIKRRSADRDQMFAETAAATESLEKLTHYLASCINCYNCRVACPVCYCKECVFLTDVFDHEPYQYLQWADRRGVLKMPTDTVFYHLTRMAHMSTACVGCGQCSNACPNDIPVMELFRMVARRTQKAFDYEAGRNVEEAPPLSVFREREFLEVTGGKN
jgi:formate dehydrogenase subunit beta